jgi:tetratricopeptide (TPR) repeat protein
MAAILQQIYRDAVADPLPYFHLNHRRVELWRQGLEQTPLARRADVRQLFAYELLNAGEVDAALREIRALLPASGPGRYTLTAQTKPLFDLLGAALMRQGEQRNCRHHPVAEACLLPLSGGGIYTWRQASEQAVSLYQQLLAFFPDDLQTRWLLNVAYMTLGQYPDSVPERWRIPGLERSAMPRLPRFPNVAPALGLAVQGMAGGVNLEDFDGDGFIDVFVTAYGLNDQVRLFLADGRGGFVDHTEAAGLDGIVGGLNTVHADYDNDADADILILRGAWLGDYGAHPNSLLRNDGDGTFEDVTAAAGLLSFHPTQTAAWGDFNNDGFLDLFVGNESGGAFQGMGGLWEPSGAPREAGQRHSSELFANNGDGTFTDVAARVGVDLNAFVKGVAWGDVNNDGMLDLLVSVLGEANRLYLNRGGPAPADWRFEEVGAAAGVEEPRFSFPCWFWDFDNDGWEDLFVASFDPRYVEPNANVAREFLGLTVQGDRARVFRNNRDGTFTDVALELGLDHAFYAMGVNYGDLDNDGYLDVYLGTGAPDLRTLIPNRMFLNRAGARFEDVTFDGGFGHLQKGHGIAFADLDHDGDQDIYAVMGGAVEGDAFPNVLFENPNPSPQNNWVVLKLEGRTANRSAIGARIRITVEDRSGARRMIHSTVSTGGSFGASSLQQEIGLGPAARIAELRITWPNRERTVDVHADLAVNRYYHVVEGAGVRTRAWHPVRLGGGRRPPGASSSVPARTR